MGEAMKMSQLFTKTSKNVPADETAKNARLLIKAGFVFKDMAGVYSYLPLGLKVLNNIARIVRDEMNAIGAQEVSMPALQVKERYEKTNRWDDAVVDNWFKTKLANGSEVGLGFSHEENLSPIVKANLGSYKELPLAIYQIQTKFRNELRSKSGLMRGREFLMKDLYSFSINQTQHDQFYEKVTEAYKKIYDRLGIGEQTYITFASGGVFSKFSHEFQTLSDAGEDTIFLDRKSGRAINKEVLNNEVLEHLRLKREDLEEVKAIEVGNTFSLGTKFSKPFNIVVTDEDGDSQTLIMGCYGIGVSRLVGVIAELMSDEKGLVWPENIAPAKVYLVRLGEEEAVIAEADKLYAALQNKGVEVLYDDRDERAGTKFADADLLGIPYRVVVSPKNIAEKKFEVKKRTESEASMMTAEELIKVLLA